MAATHQHNEILANKTILTLNLKQVARSRRRGQQGRGKIGGRWRGGNRHTQKPRRGSTTRTASNPKNTRLKFKIAFIILTFQWRTVLVVHSSPAPLPSACVCQIFILRIGSQDLLISMRAAAGPSAANECKDQARHQSRLDGCPEGPLQQGNRLKSA